MVVKANGRRDGESDGQGRDGQKGGSTGGHSLELKSVLKPKSGDGCVPPLPPSPPFLFSLSLLSFLPPLYDHDTSYDPQSRLLVPL